MDVSLFANRDAELVHAGIQRGASSRDRERLEAEKRHTARKPLTVRDLEVIARPDINPNDYADRQTEFEQVGMARLSAPPQGGDGWGLAAAWFGWLPGLYDTRDSALAAYGYVLGGEVPGSIESLRNRVQRSEGRLITLHDLEAFVADGR